MKQETMAAGDETYFFKSSTADMQSIQFFFNLNKKIVSRHVRLFQLTSVVSKNIFG